MKMVPSACGTRRQKKRTSSGAATSLAGCTRRVMASGIRHEAKQMATSSSGL